MSCQGMRLVVGAQPWIEDSGSSLKNVFLMQSPIPSTQKSPAPCMRDPALLRTWIRQQRNRSDPWKYLDASKNMFKGERAKSECRGVCHRNGRFGVGEKYGRLCHWSIVSPSAEAARQSRGCGVTLNSMGSDKLHAGRVPIPLLSLEHL
jgi:hypothetical protein